MSVLDPEYTGRVVDSAAEFEKEEEARRLKKAAAKKELSKKLSESSSSTESNSSNERGVSKLTKEDNSSDTDSSKDNAKQLLQGVNTSLSNNSDGEKPPSPFADALSSGITSGGNPAAIGGAFMMGLVKSIEHKQRMKKMGEARALMEEAKGEQQKGAIALRMGDAVSRAIGGAGRKRSINI